MELNTEILLNRIKNEVAISKGRHANFEDMLYGIQYGTDTDFDIETIFDEVCRRYAEEVNKPDINISYEAIAKARDKDKEEISQLKKQVEEKDKEHKLRYNEVEHWKNAYHNSTDRERDNEREISKLEQQVDHYKSKLEVKEKPDFDTLAAEAHSKYNFSDENEMYSILYSFECGCEKIWEEHVIPRDTTIAERDGKISHYENQVMAYIKRNEWYDARIAELEKEITKYLDLAADTVERNYDRIYASCKASLKKASNKLDFSYARIVNDESNIVIVP